MSSTVPTPPYPRESKQPRLSAPDGVSVACEAPHDTPLLAGSPLSADELDTRPGGGSRTSRAAEGGGVGQPPTCNTGVVNGSARSDSPYAWDWSSTTHQGYQGVVDDLLAAIGTEVAIPGKGLQGWSQSLVAHDAGGYKIAAVYWGGGRDDVHVVSTSNQAHDTRAAVVGIGDARTARVDTRVDTLVPFEDLTGVALAVAGQKARVTTMESRQDGVSLGRTVYVGSPSSNVRVRIYEKHLESPGLYVDGTNRVEVQLRPPSRGKGIVSAWGPAETFCASELTRRLAAQLGTDVAKPGTLQKKRETPDLERTMRAMGEQYGKAFDRWLTFSGGDVGKILDYLTNEGRAA